MKLYQNLNVTGSLALSGSMVITGSQSLFDGGVAANFNTYPVSIANNRVLVFNSPVAQQPARMWSGGIYADTNENIVLGSFNNISFLTNSVGTNALFISASGFVGVGTTVSSLGSKFSVIDAAGGNLVQISNLTNADLFINAAGGVTMLSPSTSALAFGTNSTERIRISGSNVGIGVTNPSVLLQTKDVGITNQNVYFGTGAVRIGGGSDHGSNTVLSVAPGNIFFDAPGVGGGRLFISSSGNIGIGATNPANYFSRTLTIDGASSQGIMFRASGADRGYVYQDGSFIQLGSNTGGVILKTNDTERMRITSAGAATFTGNITMARFYATTGFSSYTPDGLFNAASLFCSVSTPGAGDRIRFGYNDYGGGQYLGRIGFFQTTNWSLGGVGSAGNDFSIGTGYQGSQLYIYTNGNYAFSGSNVSDKRKKTNIKYIDSLQLDNILKLKPATFNKIADDVVNENVHTGFIAQDIMELGIPNLVHGSEEGGYGLDYDGILALAVKAIQEQQQQINELKALLNK